MQLATNDAYHPRSNHIDIRHHFAIERKKTNEVNFKRVATNEMLADFLTKPVCKDKHEHFSFKI